MLEIFITVHDQDIILKSIQEGKYDHLSKYRFIFVGNRDTSKIRDLDNVIFAKDFDDNIEQFNYLVDFTAWYLLVKNNLIETEFVSLIQYDTDITADFESATLDLISKNKNSIIGYVPYLINSVDFLGTQKITNPMFKSLKEVYDISVVELVINHVNKTGDTHWPSSNNVCTSRDIVKNFIEWAEPLMFNMNNDRYCGHAMERNVKIFSIIRKINNIYLRDKLTHYQLDSHNTQK